MAIIYTYPRISPGNKSLWVLVTDNQDEQKTKNINLEDFSRLIPEFIELNDFKLCGHPFVPVCPVPINDRDGIFYNFTSEVWEIKPQITYSLAGNENTSVSPSSFDIVLSGTDGTSDIVNIKAGSNITFGIAQNELVINSSGGSGPGGSISITDGTNTVNDVETINFTGAQVSGTTPNGNVTITSTNEVANANGTTGAPATFLLGNYNKFNFVNTNSTTPAAVFAQEDGTDNTQVNIFIPAPPTPTYPPYFNQTGALVTDPINRTSTRISNPVGESGAAGGFSPASGWIDTFKPSYNSSNTGSNQQPGPFVFTPGGASNYIIGFSGNSTESNNDAVVNVKVYDSDGTTTFEDVTTPTLDGNATHPLGTNNCITVQVSNYSKIVDPYGDPDQFRAYLSITIDIAQIFTNNNRNGGTWSAELEFSVDTGIPNPNTGAVPAATGLIFNLLPVFEDTNPLQPAAGTVNPTTINTVTNTKFLSGVKYFTAGQTFSVTSVNTEGLNGNTQKSGNLGFSALANLNTNAITVDAWNPSPGTVTGFSNSWDDTGVGFSYSSFAIQPSQFSYRGPAGKTTLTAKDPWGPNDTSTNSNALNVLVLTKSAESTALEEKFVDENFRLIRSGASLTSYSSSTALTNTAQGTTTSGFQSNFSDACCIVSSGLEGSLIAASRFRLTNGSLQPNLTSYNPDLTNNFTSFNQTPVYNRSFYYSNNNTTQSPNGSITFEGTFPGGNINAALTNGDIKIYIRRIAQSNPAVSSGPNSTAFALGTGVYNGNVWSDSAPVDSAASMVRTTTTGNVVGYTWGFYATNQGMYMEIQLIDNTIEITSINVNFNGV